MEPTKPSSAKKRRPTNSKSPAAPVLKETKSSSAKKRSATPKKDHKDVRVVEDPLIDVVGPKKTLPKSKVVKVADTGLTINDKSLPPLWIRDIHGNVQLVEIAVAAAPILETKKSKKSKKKEDVALERDYQSFLKKNKAAQSAIPTVLVDDTLLGNLRGVRITSDNEPKLKESEVEATLQKQAAQMEEQKQRLLEKTLPDLHSNEKRPKEERRKYVPRKRKPKQYFTPRDNEYFNHLPLPGYFGPQYQLPLKASIELGPYEDAVLEMEKKCYEQRVYHAPESLMFLPELS